jgi:hypothetical protein
VATTLMKSPVAEEYLLILHPDDAGRHEHNRLANFVEMLDSSLEGPTQRLIAAAERMLQSFAGQAGSDLVLTREVSELRRRADELRNEIQQISLYAASCSALTLLGDDRIEIAQWLAEALAAIQPPALPPVTLPPPPAAAPRPEPVAARTMTVNPAPSPAWWMANYSALMQAGRYGDSGLETTEEKLLAEEKWGRDPSALAAEAQDDAPPAPLPPATLADAGQVFATFPAGRLFGVFLHSVFEWMGRTGFAECAADPTLLHTELAKRCRYEGWEAHLEPLNTALQGWLRQPLLRLLPRRRPGSSGAAASCCRRTHTPAGCRWGC